MIRKIALGLIFASFSGALIYGGIYRTAARLETGNAVGKQHQNLFGVEKSKGQQYLRGDRGGSEGEFQGGTDRGSSFSEDLLPKNISDIRIFGSIMEVTPDILIIISDDGQEILIENRAWWYAQDAGLSANLGDSVELLGFYDDSGKFEVSWISNLSTGIEIAVRDASGHPYWAGSGSGRGRGQNSRS